MGDLGGILDYSLKLFWANPILSGGLALLIGGVGIYVKTVVQTIAKNQTEKLLSPKSVEEEVFDKPSGAPIASRTNEVLKELTADDLIDLYGKKTHHSKSKSGLLIGRLLLAEQLIQLEMGRSERKKLRLNIMKNGSFSTTN